MAIRGAGRDRPSPTVCCRPRHREGTWIIFEYRDLYCRAAVDELKTLDDLQFFRAWCAVVIDEHLVADCDCVDHERVTSFVVADRFSVPGGFRIGGMGTFNRI
jgi:hypothetical protein